MGSYDGCEVKMGTGRAFCRVCNKKIMKSEVAIEVLGYRLSRQVHGDPKDCKRITNMRVRRKKNE